MTPPDDALKSSTDFIPDYVGTDALVAELGKRMHSLVIGHCDFNGKWTVNCSGSYLACFTLSHELHKYVESKKPAPSEDPNG
jgi:hypothetical protein